MKSYIAYAVGGFSGIALGWLANVPTVVWSLIALMFLDVLMGLGAAFVTKTISSDVSYRGMVRKSLTLILVAATGILQQTWQTEVPLVSLVAGALCAKELISIIENAIRAGIPIPQPLVDAIEKLKK